MIDKKIFTAIARGTAALGIGLMACNTAYAQEAEEAVEAAPAADFWRLNVGVRAWSNDWTTWVDEQVTPNTVADADGKELALIPQISLQLGKFQIASSYMTSTEYTFKNIGPATADRDELDVNVGYTVVPGLTVSLGYKSIKQEFNGVAEFEYTGPTIGFSGSVPLANNFGVYASFAYGMLDAEFAGGGEHDAKYVLAEPGVSYVIPTGNAGGLDAIVLTLGYRFQSVETEQDGGFDSLRDITQGASFGVGASF